MWGWWCRHHGRMDECGAGPDVKRRAEGGRTWHRPKARMGRLGGVRMLACILYAGRQGIDPGHCPPGAADLRVSIIRARGMRARYRFSPAARPDPGRTERGIVPRHGCAAWAVIDRRSIPAARWHGVILPSGDQRRPGLDARVPARSMASHNSAFGDRRGPEPCARGVGE